MTKESIILTQGPSGSHIAKRAIGKRHMMQYQSTMIDDDGNGSTVSMSVCLTKPEWKKIGEWMGWNE